MAAGGRELLVQAEASKRVEAAVVAGEGWRENMRRLMAKRNSGNRLGKCIKMLVAGLDGALEQLDIRMQVRSLLTEGAATSACCRPIWHIHNLLDHASCTSRC